MTSSHPLVFSHTHPSQVLFLLTIRLSVLCGDVSIGRASVAHKDSASIWIGSSYKTLFSSVSQFSLSFHSCFSVIFHPPASSSVAGVLSVDEIILGSHPMSALKI